MSSFSPVISDVMIQIPLAVALYILATSGWHSLPYNVVFLYVCYRRNQPTVNERKSGSIILNKTKNK
jgi:hypothetical protein